MPTAEHPRPFLTVTEAAEWLHLSTSTIRRRIWDGELPAVRLGSGPQAPVRVDPAKLEAYAHEGSRRQLPAGATALSPHGWLEGQA